MNWEVYTAELLRPLKLTTIDGSDGMEVVGNFKNRKVARFNESNQVYVTTFGETITTKYYTITMRHPVANH